MANPLYFTVGSAGNSRWKHLLSSSSLGSRLFREQRSMSVSASSPTRKWKAGPPSSTSMSRNYSSSTTVPLATLYPPLKDGTGYTKRFTPMGNLSPFGSATVRQMSSPCTSSPTKEDARALLQETSWFSGERIPPTFLDAVANKMKYMEVDNGHIFLEEDLSIINEFYILEEGCLARTKLALDKDSSGEEHTKIQEEIRSADPDQVQGIIDQHSVSVDTIEGRGRVSGLLHAVQEPNMRPTAFATVAARNPNNEKTKLWAVSGDDFRSILASDPTFMMGAIQILSREVTSGSKSLKSIMRNRQQKGGSDAGQGNEAETLRVLCYDATSWVSESFQPAIPIFNDDEDSDGVVNIHMDYTTERLGPHSATSAAGYHAVCTFVNDTADAETCQMLSKVGVQMIAQRAAGFDRIDTKAARAYGLTVARVPAYSPYAVAEMAISLLMAVNRKIAKANSRVKMANFTLDAGLMGMDIHGKTIGVMGTGKIGQILCNIILGFGAKLLCYDVHEAESVKQGGGTYVSQEEIFATCDVIFFMMPLLPSTKHTINMDILPKLKPGVIIINTSRGGLIDTQALLKGLKSGIISGVGMDVYENEADYFFQDWSAKQIQDTNLVALLGENNVILTAHQAFFTKEAVNEITRVTLENLRDFKKGLRGTAHPNNVLPVSKD